MQAIQIHPHSESKSNYSFLDFIININPEIKLYQKSEPQNKVDLYLLPSAQTRDKSAVKPEEMKQLCDQLKGEFDYIIIDCPAGIEQGFDLREMLRNHFDYLHSCLAGLLDSGRTTGLRLVSKQTSLQINRFHQILPSAFH